MAWKKSKHTNTDRLLVQVFLILHLAHLLPIGLVANMRLVLAASGAGATRY